MAAVQLTRTHKILIGVVIAGAVVIAGIGFAGSYAAVRELAVEKGFGTFSYFFPIGIDAGICVLLALDLLLTWIRIPFPLLRQTAWVLTAATIAFNGAAAWPDPLGVGMHAVIPVLFVVSVEAARHAVGRIADITADKHMEGVRITRWLLSPIPTFRLWRRMKLWELRSYEQVIKLEQDRLIYQARLQARFGRAWRRKAPVEALMPLRLAKYGVPLAETAPAGLAAAGVEPMLLPPQPVLAEAVPVQVTPGAPSAPQLQQGRQPAPQAPQGLQGPQGSQGPQGPDEQGQPTHDSPWFAAQPLPPEAYAGAYVPMYAEGEEPPPAGTPDSAGVPIPSPRQEQIPHPEAVQGQGPVQGHGQAQGRLQGPAPEQFDEFAEYADPEPLVEEFAEAAYKAMWDYVEERQDFPNAEQLDIWLSDMYGVQHPRSASILRELTPQLRHRIEQEMAENHIP
ncbi:DUF2637 domain-containing protein [Streptomyces sp. NPDC057271]|uniref:DUF2637 domain-containing protein n=1 Tax=unclassified Streptomyces TaxID=2593676 RepID=UPI003638632E